MQACVAVSVRANSVYKSIGVKVMDLTQNRPEINKKVALVFTVTTAVYGTNVVSVYKSWRIRSSS